MNRKSGVTTLGFVLLGASLAAHAQTFADLKHSAVDYSKGSFKPQQKCSALAEYKGADILRLTAREIPPADGVPAHCRVDGIIQPEIGFQLNLPANWNGRFFMFGNGGHAGEQPEEPPRQQERAQALRHAFAVVSTDTGHINTKEPDATFAYKNQQKLVDYAFRAVHLTAVNGKRMTNEYYGRPASYSYWNACSTGGRQGLMEAQRFWDDFNGIVAGAPVTDFGGVTIGGMWNSRAIQEGNITADKLPIMAKSVYAKCDKVDGLEDGIIDDPRRCDFDPARDIPQCAAGADDAGCITPAQAAALKKIYGPVMSQGKPIFPGKALGAEIVGVNFGPVPESPWRTSMIGTERGSVELRVNASTLQNMVMQDQKYDWKRFDIDRDVSRVDAFRTLVDATNPDLSRFQNRGGKLIVYHGWADITLTPEMSIKYYESAVAKNGPNTRDFYRLFMMPGMFHCQGGVGPNRIDPFTAIVNWVEKGKAPDSLIASQFEKDKLLRTRPLCPYPQVARYSGKGSVDAANNFRCVMP